MTEFELIDPDSNLLWLAKLDPKKKIIYMMSEDGNHKWAQKISSSHPMDAFVVRGHIFLTWERPEEGFNRLADSSMIRAQDLYTGKVLWDWEDHILTVLPFGHFLFIITYRNEHNKGFLIKCRAEDGFVVWKIASQSPLISWDINDKRMIIKDSMSRVYFVDTQSGNIQKGYNL